jgi:hypothetical protein
LCIGLDWKPDIQLPAATAPISAAPTPAAGRSAVDIDASIKEQGDKIRQLKSDKAAKVYIANLKTIFLT